MKLQKAIRINMKVVAFFIIFSTMNLCLNPTEAYGFSSLREITYKNINTVLTAEDLDLQGDSNDYTFYIAPIGSESAERINLPLSLDENIYLGTNDLTILGPQGIVTVKVVVTEASREVDRDGWTTIEVSEDTRIVYVSSSEGSDDTGMAYDASEINVTTPDDEPDGDFYKKITPTYADDYEHELGTISASSENKSLWGSDWSAYQAFYNHLHGSGWLADSMPAWLQISLTSTEVVNSYAISAVRYRSSRAPKDWTLEGRNDGETWDVLHTVKDETSWGDRERRMYFFENSHGYEYYRINVTETAGGGEVMIGYFELIGPSETIAPVASPGRARELVRNGYPDWILFKRGEEWGGDGGSTHYATFSTKSGRSLSESSVVGAYGESDTRPFLKGIRLSISDNLIVNGLNVWGLTSRGENVLLEDMNFHQDNHSYITDSSGWSNLEMRRIIISQPQQNGLAHAMYFHNSDGLLFEEMLFNLHIDQTVVEDTSQGQRNMWYLQTGNKNISLYRNIVTNSVRNSLMNRGSGRSIYRENILAHNPNNIADLGPAEGMPPTSPLHIDGNVIIEGGNSIVTTGMIHDRQNTVSNNIILGSTGIAIYSDHERKKVERVRVSNNILHKTSSGLSIVDVGEDINVFDNVFHSPENASRVIDQRASAAEQGEYTYKNNRYLSGRTYGEWFRRDGTNMDFDTWVSETGDTGSEALSEPLNFVDPDRTLGTYQEYLSGETYEGGSGTVNVVDGGQGNYSQVQWVSGDKFNKDWRKWDDARIINIDGNRYWIDEVVNDETLTLSGEGSASLPEPALSGVEYFYEPEQLGLREFIESAKQQSRHSWNWDYHPVKIQDYFREGFQIGFASPGAPEEVADLKAETLSETDGEVLLSWTATGKNGNNIGGFYEVRYATYPTEENKPASEWWDSIGENPDKYKAGTMVFENPKNTGDTEERIVRGLYPGATFYFGIRAYNSELEKSGFDKNLSGGNPASAVSGNANPKPPSMLRFNYIGTDADLIWDKSTSSVLKKYIIHKSTVSEGSVKSTKTVCDTDTKHTICLNEEKNYFAEHDKYFFTVSAVNIVESTSTHSNEVKLTPDLTPPVIEDLTAHTRVLGRKKIKVSVTDDRQVYEVGGGYRSLGSGSGEYEDLEFFPEPEEGSPSYAGRAEIDDFYISSEGFEYYITASDAFNTSTTTWVQVRSARDLPEQGFITPNNPELIFGSEVEEVLITDVRGNEVFKDKRGSSNYIVWNPSRDGSISLESGLYIYRVKIEGGYKYGSVVIAK